MKFIKRLFANDWIPVWVSYAEWRIVNHGHPTGEYSNISYVIKYSKYLNEYKLEEFGIDPKQHPAYKDVVKKLNEFIKNGH